MDTTRLGQLALSYGLLDEAQLERALDLQETQPPARHLGEVLVAEGMLSADTLRRLLSAQHKEVARTGAGERLERAQIATRLAPPVAFDDLLAALEELAAEELHLTTGSRPALRLHGRLHVLRPEPLLAEEVEAAVAALTQEPSAAAQFASQRSLRLVHVRGESRYRANLFQQRRGPAAVLCRIDAKLPNVDALGLPPIVREVPRIRTGLVLVTGPRASGKTTTLAALVELINEERRAHVVCLEETIEFLHESRRSLVTQIEVGREAADWDRALHDTLRLDPDVILAGDLDSPGRLRTALRAAETGHLVLGTLPTRRAEQTLSALVRGCGLARRNQVCHSLANLLRFVICQQLVPDVEGERLVLASEVLRNTPAVAHMIREQRFHQLGNVLQTSRERGMQTLDDSLADLALAGTITAGEALSRAGDHDHLFQRLQQAGGLPQ